MAAGGRMQSTETTSTDRFRAYRRRKVANGRLQFIADLPRETLAFIDEIKERQGLRNRGQVLEQLIEIGRQAAQQQ
jgi:hypothetical protein